MANREKYLPPGHTRAAMWIVARDLANQKLAVEMETASAKLHCILMCPSLPRPFETTVHCKHVIATE